MEARFGGEAQAQAHHRHFNAMGSAEFRAVGKRTLEWDLNDWKWDGDLFMATPLSLNPVPLDAMKQKFIPNGSGVPGLGGSGSSNSSSSSSYEVNPDAEKGKRDLEKRRRVVVVEDNNLAEDAAATLALKLGGHDGHGHGCAINGIGNEAVNWEEVNGKKNKFAGSSSNRAACQVEDCGTDLSSAKDYHRRHKVCEMHSKASRAIVGSVLQRFCQQCSRFHVLQEFDEGKRSCRRRLAGHNKRRRKTNPDTPANGSSLNDDQASGYLLISLLKILSNMHSNRSDQPTDQDMLTRILRSLGGNSGEHAGRNMSALLQEPHNDAPNDGTSMGNSEVISTLLSNGLRGSSRPPKHQSVSIPEIPQQGANTQDARGGGHLQMTTSAKPDILNRLPSYSEVRDGNAGRIKVNSFDLNDIYVDSDNVIDLERFPVPGNLKTSSPPWLHQDSSPPQTGGNSDSASAQSPSSSNGDTQSRTDRIVFKLFGKEPNDFPLVLRAQILDWLSHSPSDIESYIRPGCVVLTIYLRQAEAAWEELCFNLGSSLSRLMEVTDDTFWRTGWVHVRVQHQIAFIYNGQVVVDTYLPHKSDKYAEIISVRPIAISSTKRAQFSVKGFNLSRPSTRLLCALEGKYLVREDTQEVIYSVDGLEEHDDLQGAAQELTDDVDGSEEHDDLQCVNFSCSIPTVMGHGFFEIEDDGLSSSIFPFIVAEENVCFEIRMLEDVLDSTSTDAIAGRTGQVGDKNQAMDFIQEMGWLLHRCHLKTRLGGSDPNTDLYPLKRFTWLVDFSMDRDWCAVVKKLLDVLLDGNVGVGGEHASLDLALPEMGLLHRAVRRNSRPLVQLLLRYDAPERASVAGGGRERLFRPDVVGPAGLTPLHIAAGKDDSEDVLDALTDDPGMVGIEAWKSARDSAGFTPEDYARLRGHFSYIHAIQKKTIKKPAPGHVVLDISSNNSTINQKQNSAATTFQIASKKASCKLCGHHSKVLACRAPSRSLVYRPAMLSMVAIAAVCVCVALLFKSSPEVLYVFRPFRWELLGYGTR